MAQYKEFTLCISPNTATITSVSNVIDVSTWSVSGDYVCADIAAMSSVESFTIRAEGYEDYILDNSLVDSGSYYITLTPIVTIESEIQRIKNNVSNAYSVCNSKGATMPEVRNVANLSNCIRSIETGDASTVGKYIVKVIDYDGTVLKEGRANEGDTFNLPASPLGSEGKTFHSWSSPVTITSGSITVPNQDVIIGATYTVEGVDTTSGYCEFDITLNDRTGLNVTLNMTGNKDWGDGTTDTLTTHEYEEEGNYTIICDGTISGSLSISMNIFGSVSDNGKYICTEARLDNITTIPYYSFNRCISLKRVTFSNDITTIESNGFYQCFGLTDILLPSTITTIGSNCFNTCYSLKDLILPNGITTIGGYAFSNCTALSNAIIPNTITGTALGNGLIFNGCQSLKNIVLPKGITAIGQSSFGGCCILEHISIPDTVTSLGLGVFASCYALKHVTLPNNITSIGQNLFNFCYSLQETNIPNGVTRIDISAFAGCYNLTSITIPNTVTYIGNSAFYNCGIINITIPNSVTEIGSGAFQNCNNLTSVIMSDSITSLNYQTFDSCFNLTSIKLSGNLSTIDYSAFNNCFSILDYDFSGCTTIPTLNNINTFTNINKLATIKVPFNLYLDWVEATNWSTYSDYIYGGVPATITFNTTPNTMKVYVRDVLVEGNELSWCGDRCSYVCLEGIGNTLKRHSNILQDIEEGGVYIVPVNVTSYNTNTITVNTGESDCNVKLIIDGKEYTATPSVSDNTKYVFELYSNEDVEITCRVTHPLAVKPIEVSVTYEGTNLTIDGTGLTLGYNTYSKMGDTSTNGSAYVLNSSDSVSSWFDGNTSNYSSLRYSYLTTSYGVVREFDNAIELGKVVFYPYSTSAGDSPQNWIIQGRNSSSDTWTTIGKYHIHDYYSSLPNTNPIELIIDCDTSYKMYRYLVTESTSANEYSSYAYVRELEMYELVVIPFDMSKKKTFTLTTNVSGCTAYIINSNGVKMEFNTGGTNINGIAVIEDNEVVTLYVEKDGYTKYIETITGDTSVNSYSKNVTLEEKHVDVDLTPGITSYGWKVSSKTNPQESLGWEMYESDMKNIDSGYAVMKVTVDGDYYNEFTLYINSYAESSCDYTYCTKLDSTTYNSTGSPYIQGQTTSGFQYGPETFDTNHYRTITYTDIPSGEHFFYVVFKTDGSSHSYYDAGFVLIDLNQ